MVGTHSQAHAHSHTPLNTWKSIYARHTYTHRSSHSRAHEGRTLRNTIMYPVPLRAYSGHALTCGRSNRLRPDLSIPSHSAVAMTTHWGPHNCFVLACLPVVDALNTNSSAFMYLNCQLNFETVHHKIERGQEWAATIEVIMYSNECIRYYKPVIKRKVRQK